MLYQSYSERPEAHSDVPCLAYMAIQPDNPPMFAAGSARTRIAFCLDLRCQFTMPIPHLVLLSDAMGGKVVTISPVLPRSACHILPIWRPPIIDATPYKYSNEADKMTNESSLSGMERETEG